MLNKEYTKQGQLKHSQGCNMSFGKKDSNCPRCVDLLNGATPRSSWHKAYYQQQVNESQAIRAHFTSERHLSGKCGVVCTFGEW